MKARGLLLPHALAAVLLLLASGAGAHQQSLSYGDYRIHGATVSARLRFSPHDLPAQLQPAPGADGKVSPGALERVSPALLAATLGALAVQSSNEPCAATGTGRAALDTDGGVSVTGDFLCPRNITKLTVRLGFLSSFQPGHTDLSIIAFDGDAPEQRVAQAGSDTFSVERKATLGATMLRFLLLGIEHILTGYDHIAFLIGLLLLGGTLRGLVGIVSAFTVAHSITLALAALDLVVPPPSLIEPLIALSIVFIAVENLWALRAGAGGERARLALKHRWMITFAFGLIHGFGFASALRELHLPRAGLAATLVTFNLGVEAGQICIVALAFPLLKSLRERPRARVAWIVSSAIGVLGLFWFAQRI